MREGTSQEVGQRTTGAKALRLRNLVLFLEQREGKVGIGPQESCRGVWGLISRDLIHIF